ncbi:MAG: 30S ribosomal protein S6 [bacterium]|nr:30S ribosomal protein S6 [bacterium]
MEKNKTAKSVQSEDGMDEKVLKRYELVYLIPNKYSEDELAPIQESVVKFIKDNGGKIISEDNWGKRRLSYNIGLNYHAYYYIIEFELTPDKLVLLEKNLRLSDEILRHLIVLKRVKSAQEIKSEKEAAEKRAEEIAQQKEERQALIEKSETKKPARKDQFVNASEAKTKAPQKKEEMEKIDINKLDEELDKILKNTEDLI